MKLIQLNLWMGRLDKQIVQFLREQKPDFICVQEAVGLSESSGGFFLTLDDIKNLDQFKLYSAPVCGFNFMNRQATFGNAILSKQPALATKTTFTNLEYDDRFDFDHDYNIRNFLHVVIKIPDGNLNIVTHHGYHINEHKNGDEQTLRQMKQIGEYIDNLDGPVILTGDFNLAPHSKSVEQINHRLNNLSIDYKLDTTRTELTGKAEVCDYIFVDDTIKVNNFYASDTVVSDHKALVLEFDV